MPRAFHDGPHPQVFRAPQPRYRTKYPISPIIRSDDPRYYRLRGLSSQLPLHFPFHAASIGHVPSIAIFIGPQPSFFL
jgi:hypothetical protein